MKDKRATGNGTTGLLITIRFVAILLLVLLIGEKTMSQPVNRHVDEVVLPTPQAAAFGQYIDVPVNHFTGTPNISIPIYTVQDGGLSDPISLTYHGSGIRSTQYASWCGLGFNLRAGGMVTRTVQGLHDTHAKGYWHYDAGSMALYEGLGGGSFISGCDGLQGTDIAITEIAGGSRDGEPDIYSFTIPGGYSGKFTIDKDRAVHLIPRQDILIDITYSAMDVRFSQITITTPDGNKHYFGNTPGGSENAFDFQTAGNSSPYVINWHLVKSTSHDEIYSINYSYDSDSYSYRTPKSNTIEYVAGINSTTGQGESYITENTGNSYTTTSISGKKLASITTTSETVTFTSTLSREDLLTSEALNRIEITTGGYCKAFDFSYDYFTEGTSNLTPEKRKLQLMSLQEKSCDNEIMIPSYTFEYYGDVQSGNGKIYLPGLLSKQIDHWGYYNGQTGNDGQVINIPMTNGLQCNGPSVITRGSANRDVNTTKTVHGTLQKITYPTGGHTLFEFEAHDAQFFRSSITTPTVGLAMSICTTPDPVNGCCGPETEEMTKSFTAEEIMANIVFEFELSRSPEGTPCHNSSTFGKVTAFKNGEELRSIEYGLSSFEDDHKIENLSITNLIDQSDLEADVTYTFKIERTNGRVSFRVFTSSFSTNTNDVGGVRIKKITQHDGIDVNRDIVTEYEYEDPNNAGESSGVILGEPLYTTTLAQSAGVLGGANMCAVHFTDASIMPLSDFEGYHVAYKYVKEIHPGNGYRTFKCHLGLSPAYYQAVGGNNLTTPIPFDRSKGFLLGQASYNNSMPADRLQEQSSEFRAESTLSLPGVMLRAYLSNCGSNIGHMYWRAYYVQTTRRARLMEQTSYMDGVSTTYNYEYDPTDRFAPRIRQTMTNSDGTQYHQIDTFPHDLTGQVYTDMVSLNMITPVITTHKVGPDPMNAVISDGVVTDYELITTANGSFPYPKRYKRHEVTWDNGMYDRECGVLQATIDSYDSPTGRPNSVTIDGWKPLTYTWNTNGSMASKTLEGHTTSYSYHGSSRLLSGVTNVDLTSQSYTYDDLCRLKTITDDCRTVTTTLDYIYGVPEGGNYIRTTTDYTQTLPYSALDDLIDRQYMDGLGRPLQIVKEDQGPTSNEDVVIATSYDNRGRLLHQYEPKSIMDNSGAFQDDATIQAWDKETYTYEESPLSRQVSSTHTSWPHAWQTQYGSNTSAIDGHVANTLTKLTKIDPDGRQAISYTDKRGRLIASVQAGVNGATPLTTITRYDDKDRSVMIIPPGATAASTDLIYTYQYYNNDLIRLKKVPDRTEIEYRYNNRDLLACYQDGHLRARSSLPWIATSYDDYGRALQTGYGDAVDNNTTTNPTILAGDVLTSTIYNPVTHQHKDKPSQHSVRVIDPDLTLGNYLTAMYAYDNCGRMATTTSSHILNTATNAEQVTFTYDEADNILSSDYQQTVNGTTHHIDEVRTIDFAGRTLEYRHKYLSPTFQTISRTSYTEKNQIEQQQLGQNSLGGYLQTCDYNYLGNQYLKRINTSSLTGNDLFYLELNYDNITTGAGADAQKNGNIAEQITRISGKDRFIYGYVYNTYNRITSATSHNIDNADVLTNANDYTTSYSYDDRGNFTSLTRNGQYANNNALVTGQIDVLTFLAQTGTNKISTITDNALPAIKRLGAKNANATTFDYDDNGNMTIDPGRGSNITYNHLNLPATLDFGDGKQLEYTYSAEGTLVKKEASVNGSAQELRHYIGPSEYKSNTLVQINHDHGRVARQDGCDQNQQVDGLLSGNDTYGGDHITSEATIGNTGNVLFKGKQRVKMLPGFKSEPGAYFKASIEPCPTSPWQYEYTLKDHLGNTRVLFADVDGNGSIDPGTEILDESHYYPFGMKQDGDWQNRKKQDNQYLYNGKELHEDFGLDWYNYGARFYDPSIGRFTGVDPLANTEHSVSMTPYHYVANNPINNIDPDGLDWYQNNETGEVHWQEGSDEVDGHTNIGATYVLTGTNGLIFHNQNEVVGTLSFSDAEGDQGISPMSAALATSGVLLADDISGVGVVDDAAIPFILIGGALITGYNYITSTQAESLKHLYVPPPAALEAFPSARPAKSKTGRKRWIDSKGKIYEWDYQHGDVEVYDKTGKKHEGSFDDKTGERTGDPVPGRRTEK